MIFIVFLLLSHVVLDYYMVPDLCHLSDFSMVKKLCNYVYHKEILFLN